MNATKGYFSLVQYCPDLARQEAANVGVVLFCPDLQFIRARTTDSVGRNPPVFLVKTLTATTICMA